MLFYYQKGKMTTSNSQTSKISAKQKVETMTTVSRQVNSSCESDADSSRLAMSSETSKQKLRSEAIHLGSESAHQCESSAKKTFNKTNSVELSTMNYVSLNRKIQVTKPNSLPERVRVFYERRHSDNYSDSEKKRRRKRKQKWANEVGWQKRRGRHRHEHQGVREKEYLNYMNGLPLDFDIDELQQ